MILEDVSDRSSLSQQGLRARPLLILPVEIYYGRRRLHSNPAQSSKRHQRLHRERKARLRQQAPIMRITGLTMLRKNCIWLTMKALNEEGESRPSETPCHMSSYAAHTLSTGA